MPVARCWRLVPVQPGWHDTALTPERRWLSSQVKYLLARLEHAYESMNGEYFASGTAAIACTLLMRCRNLVVSRAPLLRTSYFLGTGMQPTWQKSLVEDEWFITREPGVLSSTFWSSPVSKKGPKWFVTNCFSRVTPDH